jgi:hypothetical protein
VHHFLRAEAASKLVEKGRKANRRKQTHRALDVKRFHMFYNQIGFLSRVIQEAVTKFIQHSLDEGCFQ